MVLADRDEVRRAVLTSLQDVTGVPQSQMRDENSLLRDLKMTGDDFTFVFVPNVEKALGVKIQPSVWRKISTVGEAVEVFVEARTQRTGS